MIPDLPPPALKSRSAETLWSRAIMVFGMVLLVSFGMCGLNLVAVLGVNGAIRGAQNAAVRQTISRALLGFGYVEVLGMILGIVGLVVSMIGAGISALITRNRS